MGYSARGQEGDRYNYSDKIDIGAFLQMILVHISGERGPGKDITCHH